MLHTPCGSRLATATGRSGLPPELLARLSGVNDPLRTARTALVHLVQRAAALQRLLEVSTDAQVESETARHLARLEEDAAHMARLRTRLLALGAEAHDGAMDELREELEFIELFAEAEAELALELA